jgi:hypothetical protein
MLNAAAFLVLLAIAAAPCHASKPTIWFCPLDLRPDGHGASDYMELFKPDAAWQKAARHVGVFKIYPQWIHNASDQDLKTEFADLNRRHIGLAMEFGVLTARPGRGRGVEGQGGESLLAMARRVHDNGGILKYVAMDEPIFFGTVYNGKNAFALTVDEMAENAAANIKAMWNEFPNVQVGDIEPLAPTTAQGLSRTELIARYVQGMEAFQKALGRPLAFFDADIDWGAPDYIGFLKDLRHAVVAHHLPFGVIYNGQGENSNADWLRAARRRTVECEAKAGTPDVVIFQSWNEYPHKLLPETDRDALTSLIDNYFETPTQCTCAVRNGEAFGRLVTDRGTPVRDAAIELTIKPVASTATTAEYRRSTTIPVGAVTAVLGVRVHTEGGGPGDCDIRISDISMQEAGKPATTLSFATPADLDQWGGLPASSEGQTIAVENGALHIKIGSGHKLVLNSRPITVSGGASAELVVQAAIPEKSVGTGNFDLMFIGDKRELERLTIPFDVPETTLPVATTAADGSWRASLPPGEYQVTCNYDGDKRYRPCLPTTAHN